METTAQDIPHLARVPLFADLDEESLKELSAVARKRIYRQGEVIFHRDDPGTALYIVKEGKVKIGLTSPDGQEVSLTVFGAGECFGELAVLDGEPRSADAIALERAELYALQRQDFVNVVLNHPKIAIQVMKVISQRLRQADQQIEDLLFLDVYGRVAKKLLELSETHGSPTSQGVRIELRLTQQELASMVGASRESVNKVMGYFTDKRYIMTDKHKITLMKLADLRKRVY